jgi:octaprenyl-diphosphate synthase
MRLATQTAAAMRAAQNSSQKGLQEAELDLSICKHLLGIEECLQKRLTSHSRYPRELSERLVASGGKRIRPLLLLATFESLVSLKNSDEKVPYEDLYQLGAVAELVHTATLFHDDVIDQSEERRQIPTAQMLHGNKIAILVGDYIYAEAFARLMERAFLYPSQKLAATIQQLVEGEILQHEVVSSREFDSKKLIQIAELKTASLFSWCSETGAWAANRKDLLKDAFSLGHHLGLAFQIIDDTIDTLAATELSDEFIKEFVASAPSYPLLLLCEKSDESYKEWRDLPQASAEDQKKIIEKLLEGCRSEDILSQCRSRIEESLALAGGHIETLGSSATLRAILEQLYVRAEDALGGEKLL